MVDLLLDAGPNSARALTTFLRGTYLETSEFNALYPKLLDNVTPPRNQRNARSEFPDPVNVILETNCTKDACYDAIHILLRSGSFSAGCLYGASSICPGHSYVFNAIQYNQPAALKLFLSHGAQPDDLIEHIFATDRELYQGLKSYTFLTIAVELGRTSCIAVLLKHAQDIIHMATSPDGAGRSAINLAQSYASATHPRVYILADAYWTCHLENVLVSTATDAATLSLLRAALRGVETGISPGVFNSSLTGKMPRQSSRNAPAYCREHLVSLGQSISSCLHGKEIY
jgi:hypothetical protein